MAIPQAGLMLTVHIIATKYHNDQLESPDFHYHPDYKSGVSWVPLY